MEKELKSTENQGNNQGNKMTYEQLNEACMQLYQQNQTLLKQLQQANLANMFKRLDYLFLVLKNHMLFDVSFVEKAIEEIQDALTVTREEENEAKEESQDNKDNKDNKEG